MSRLILKEENTSNRTELIRYYYPNFLFGFHSVKIEARDSFGNIAVEEFDVFVINLR